MNKIINIIFYVVFLSYIGGKEIAIASTTPLLDYANSNIPLTNVDTEKAQLVILEASKNLILLEALKGNTSEIPADMKNSYAKAASDLAYGYHLANFHKLSMLYFIRAAELNQKPSSWLDAAVEYDIAGEDTKAEEAFDKAEPDKSIKSSVALSRGRFYYVREKYDKAKTEFVLAYEDAPDDHDRAYAAIWSQLTTTRLDGREDNKIRDGWPWPILSVLQKKTDERDMVAVIKSLPEKERNAALCETLFYLGEQQWIKSHKEQALQYFRAVLNTRVSSYVEYQIVLHLIRIRGITD